MDEVAVVSIRTAKSYQNELDERIEDTKNVREAVRTIKAMSARQKRRTSPPFEDLSRQVRNYLFGSFRSAAPFALLEEASILRAPAYQNVTAAQREDAGAPGRWRTSLYATPDGYRPLDSDLLQKKTHLRTLFEGLPSAPDGLLFAETEFTIVRGHVKRPGQAKRPGGADAPRAQATPANGDTVYVDVKATVRVNVLDRSGGTVLKVTQTARADQPFPFVYGQGWETDPIDRSTRRATRLALKKVTTTLREKISKSTPARATASLKDRAGNASDGRTAP